MQMFLWPCFWYNRSPNCMINGSLRTKIVTSSVAIFDHTLFFKPITYRSSSRHNKWRLTCNLSAIGFSISQTFMCLQRWFRWKYPRQSVEGKQNHQLKKLFDFLSKSPMFHYLIRLPPYYDCNLQHSLILLSIVFCVWTFFL